MGALLSVSFCNDTATDFQWVSLFRIYAPSLKRPFSAFLRCHCSWNFNRNATVTSCSNKQEALASTVVAWEMNEPLLRSKVPVVSASSEDPQRQQSQHQTWWSSTRVWIRKWKEKTIFVCYKREHQRTYLSLCIEGVTLPSHRHLAVANRLWYVYIYRSLPLTFCRIFLCLIYSFASLLGLKKALLWLLGRVVSISN